MSIARRTLVPIGVIASVILILTGVWLAMNYRPANSFFGEGDSTSSTVSAVHAVAAGVLALATLVGAVLAFVAIARHAIEQRGAVAVLALAGGIGVVGAYLSGLLLPWDQLALTARTLGVDGVFLPESVKYVLLGSDTVEPGTYQTWVWIHVCGFPVLLLATAGGAALLARRAHRSAESTSASFP